MNHLVYIVLIEPSFIRPVITVSVTFLNGASSLRIMQPYDSRDCGLPTTIQSAGFLALARSP
ncbi:hypothetical protein D3C71_1816430 [compost metagenome]